MFATAQAGGFSRRIAFVAVRVGNGDCVAIGGWVVLSAGAQLEIRKMIAIAIEFNWRISRAPETCFPVYIITAYPMYPSGVVFNGSPVFS
jgi:hypothetical protein